MIRAGVAATVSLLAFAACAGRGVVPSSPGGLDQSASNNALQSLDALALTTCATTPPQYEWIMKGACAKITLKPLGSSFSLGAYKNITVKGSIGKNNVKTSAIVYLADATDTASDIKTWKGKAFIKYKGRGTTFIYAAAVNQSSQVIKPIAEKGKPILQYIITDSKGLPGKTCGAAVLTVGQRGSFTWTPLPGTFSAKGNTVTITQYNVPSGFELPPKIPLYFAVNCYS
jgi:hypothetical protein